MEYHEVGASHVSERWKQHAFKTGIDRSVRQQPRCGRAAIDPGDLAPRTIPFCPLRVPDQGIKSFGQVDDLAQADILCGQRRRRRDGRTLAIFLEGRLWCLGEIECLDTRPIKSAAVACRTGATQRQIGPFRCQKVKEKTSGSGPIRLVSPACTVSKISQVSQDSLNVTLCQQFGGGLVIVIHDRLISIPVNRLVERSRQFSRR